MPRDKIWCKSAHNWRRADAILAAKNRKKHKPKPTVAEERHRLGEQLKATLAAEAEGDVQ